METYGLATNTRPIHTDLVSRVDVRYEGSLSGGAATCQISAGKILDGAVSVDELNGRRNMFVFRSKGGIAGITLIIEGQCLEESMGRNENCYEKWNKKRYLLHGFEPTKEEQKTIAQRREEERGYSR